MLVKCRSVSPALALTSLRVATLQALARMWAGDAGLQLRMLYHEHEAAAKFVLHSFVFRVRVCGVSCVC